MSKFNIKTVAANIVRAVKGYEAVAALAAQIKHDIKGATDAQIIELDAAVVRAIAADMGGEAEPSASNKAKLSKLVVKTGDETRDKNAQDRLWRARSLYDGGSEGVDNGKPPKTMADRWAASVASEKTEPVASADALIAAYQALMLRDKRCAARVARAVAEFVAK